MNILTFDIEDWWVYDHYKIGRKADWLPRLDRYLNEILDLLDEKHFQATFFCLGIVAREYPDVIKRIDNRGHHIACHSDGHEFLAGKDREFFHNDTSKAIDSLQQVTGKKVNAYRAPAFSIGANNLWAFETLAELGIEYDSSIYPANRAFGGFSAFQAQNPVSVEYKGLIIKEFPMTLTPILGRRLAYAGGGYFRMLPYPFIKKTMQQSAYNMTYFHLKDFDREQKRLFYTRYFQSYCGLNGAFDKFHRLLSDFGFVSLQQAANAVDWGKQHKITI